MAKAKAEKEKGAEVKKEKKEPKRRSAAGSALMVAVPLLLAAAIFLLVVLPMLSVPFSTFKANFGSASRIAVFAVYTDQSNAGAVISCATQAVQVAAHTRNATTIDFYVFNATSCTYPVGGLGHTVTLATNTIRNCLSMAGSETSLFLNYSSYNHTTIMPYKLYVYGNAQYMSRCPIAVDLS
jgi:hypothetical protein